MQPRLASINSYITRDVLQEHLDGPRGAALPDAIKDADRLSAAVSGVVHRAAEDVSCLVHGDAHAGNVFETADGSLGLIDWQIVQRSSWALDVAYHVGAVLDVDVREKNEQQLLAHYLDRLAHHGVAPPSWDDAWLNYRICLIYGYYLWAVTRLVDPPIINEFVTRLGSAVAYHASLDLLGA